MICPGCVGYKAGCVENIQRRSFAENDLRSWAEAAGAAVSLFFWECWEFPNLSRAAHTPCSHHPWESKPRSSCCSSEALLCFLSKHCTTFKSPAEQDAFSFLMKASVNTGLQDGKWSCIFMWLFCNSRIMFNKDPLQLHQYFIPSGCWWPQGFPYHVKLSEMEFFTLYSTWNFLLLLLSISLTYFRNDSSGFIPNIAAMTQPLFLVLDSEMHLLLLHSLCLCNFPL